MHPTEAQLASALSAAKEQRASTQTELDGLLASIFNAEQIELVDKWIASNDPTIDRSEAIRRLVDLGLTVGTKASPSRQKK